MKPRGKPMKDGDEFVGRGGKRYLVIRMTYRENPIYAKYTQPAGYVPPEESSYLTAVEVDENHPL